MGCVIKRGKLMTHPVAGPVLFASDTHDVAMRQSAGPHEIGTSAVVVRISDNERRFVDDCLQGPLAEAVRQLDFCRI